MRLIAEPLTAEAFAPFGEVIEASDAARHFTINGGNTERFHDLADIDAGTAGRVIVSIRLRTPRSMSRWFIGTLACPSGRATRVRYSR